MFPNAKKFQLLFVLKSEYFLQIVAAYAIFWPILPLPLPPNTINMEIWGENNTVLRCISHMANKLENSGLKPSKLKGSIQATRKLAQYLGVDERQALMFAAAYAVNLKEGRSDLNDVVRFLNITMGEMMSLFPDVKVLLNKRYMLFSDGAFFSTQTGIMSNDYRIPSEVMNCIIDNLPITKLEPEPPMDIFKFIQVVSDRVNDSYEEDHTKLLTRQISKLEDANPHLALPNELLQKDVGILDRILLYETCNDLIKNQHTDLNSTLSDIYNDAGKRFTVATSIIANMNSLTRQNLIKTNGASFMNDVSLELTEYAVELIFGDKALLFLDKNESSLMKPEQLTTKKLFFDDELNRQVQILRDSLVQEQFLQLQDRLRSQNMPHGIAAIFYGEPGTGKTETVLQLAKATQRAVMHVDISNTKSMWFGQSEKEIKAVFTRYANLCKHSVIKPILLFNEADAVFGKRKENQTSSVDQTENAIQNIILEEMEKIEGILIATTNLVGNLDAAFERRFLFKIRFTKPNLDTKRQIWLDKMNDLDENSALTLASAYSFSGGEIDNIVRKITIEEVLTGQKPDLKRIQDLCESERLFARKEKIKVGFV